jgi:LysM repeat protein
MHFMIRSKTIRTILAALCVFLLASCKAGANSSNEESFSVGELTPYYTSTAVPTATPTPVTAPTATPLPTLTPSPVIYVVKDKDTLWAIAANHGLTTAELQAANPGVDAYTLSAGDQLVLPAPGSTSATQAISTPTAVAVALVSPECTPSLTGGLYCFGIARNEQGFDVQNLTAQFIITDSATGDRYIQEGLLPLNRLTSGSSLPLFTYFMPPIPLNYTVEMQLLSAVPVSESDSGFLDLTIADAQTTISSDGYSAEVTGSVYLSDVAQTASRYWLAAVGYDADGSVVAVRQFSKASGLSGGAVEQFSMNVYSIAGKIDHVDLFGEATP